ncbi:MAG: tetratricopeptide repeat protein [Bacteroidales bacterium]
MHLKWTYFLNGLLLLIIFSCNRQPANNAAALQDTVPGPLRELTQKIAQSPGDPAFYLERARWFVKNARYEEALKDIRITLNQDSLSPAALVILGDAYLNLGQPVLAENAYAKALKLQPSFNDALLGMARYFLVLKNHDQTLALTAKAIINQSFNPTAYYLAAWSFMEKGDTLSALKNYLKAVEQNPDYFDAHVQLGVLYSQKQPQMAEAYFKNALRLQPRHVHTRYLLGLLYQEQGQTDKAIATHQDNLAIDPHYIPSLFAMGVILMADRLDFGEAIHWYDKVIALDNKNAPAFLNRGYCHEQLGNLREAAADYRRALEIDPALEKAAQGLHRIASFN